MKDDDIEKLFGSMNEEFKLIYQKEQERKKEIAEKRSMTLLRNGIAKYNEVREERRKAMEERSNGNRVKLPSIVFPGWVHPGYVGGWGYDPFFGGELYAHYLYYIVSQITIPNMYLQLYRCLKGGTFHH